MRRIALLAILASAVTFGGPLFADSAKDRIVSRLAEEGYREIRISRTLLGRVRIVATGKGERREIVFNPASGEILRDYVSLDGSGGTSGSSGHNDERSDKADEQRDRAEEARDEREDRQEEARDESEDREEDSRDESDDESDDDEGGSDDESSDDEPEESDEEEDDD